MSTAKKTCPLGEALKAQRGEQSTSSRFVLRADTEKVVDSKCGKGEKIRISEEEINRGLSYLMSEGKGGKRNQNGKGGCLKGKGTSKHLATPYMLKGLNEKGEKARGVGGKSEGIDYLNVGSVGRKKLCEKRKLGVWFEVRGGTKNNQGRELEAFRTEMGGRDREKGCLRSPRKKKRRSGIIERGKKSCKKG